MFWFFFFFFWWYCLVKHFNNIIQFLLKISLIWWDKFIFNFKYIFINETSFIRIRVLRGGAGLCRTPRDGDGTRKFSSSCERGGDRVRQNHAGWGWRPLAAFHANQGSPVTTLTCKKWHIYICQKNYMLN